MSVKLYMTSSILLATGLQTLVSTDLSLFLDFEGNVTIGGIKAQELQKQLAPKGGYICMGDDRFKGLQVEMTVDDWLIRLGDLGIMHTSTNVVFGKMKYQTIEEPLFMKEKKSNTWWLNEQMSMKKTDQSKGLRLVKQLILDHASSLVPPPMNLQDKALANKPTQKPSRVTLRQSSKPSLPHYYNSRYGAKQKSGKKSTVTSTSIARNSSSSSYRRLSTSSTCSSIDKRKVSNSFVTHAEGKIDRLLQDLMKDQSSLTTESYSGSRKNSIISHARSTSGIFKKKNNHEKNLKHDNGWSNMFLNSIRKPEVKERIIEVVLFQNVTVEAYRASLMIEYWYQKNILQIELSHSKLEVYSSPVYKESKQNLPSQEISDFIAENKTNQLSPTSKPKSQKKNKLKKNKSAKALQKSSQASPSIEIKRSKSSKSVRWADQVEVYELKATERCLESDSSSKTSTNRFIEFQKQLKAALPPVPLEYLPEGHTSDRSMANTASSSFRRRIYLDGQNIVSITLEGSKVYFPIAEIKQLKSQNIQRLWASLSGLGLKKEIEKAECVMNTYPCELWSLLQELGH